MKLREFYENPTPATFEMIAYQVIGGTPWRPTTLLQAIRRVDSSFPRSKDPMFDGLWSRIPSKCLVEAAFRRVEADDAIL